MPLEILKQQETTIFDDVEFNSITGQLDANNEIITNVAGPPVSNSDGVNKQYVDDNISGVTTGFVKADGTIPMTGDLDLGTNNIINVVDPVNPQDVSTKNYTDTNTSNNNYLLKSGGTMAGDLIATNTNNRTYASLTPQVFDAGTYTTVQIGNYQYICGRFTAYGTLPNSRFLVKRNVYTGAFSSVGSVYFTSGFGIIHIIAIGTDLYIGGSFVHSTNNNFLKYDTLTQTFSSLGTTFAGSICWMVHIDDYLYIAGDFDDVNGIPNTYNIARYDLSLLQWEAISTQAFNNGSLEHIEYDGNDIIYVGGNFNSVNAIANTAHICKYTVSTELYSSISTDQPDRSVRSMELVGTTLYVGGHFDNIGAVPNTAKFVVYDTIGLTYSSLGIFTSAISATGVETITYDNDNNKLFVGGNIESIDGDTTNKYISYYDFDTTTWNKLQGVDIPSGSGFPSIVRIDLIEGRPYISGSYNAGIANVANTVNYSVYQSDYNNVKYVDNPIEALDAANKSYVDYNEEVLRNYVDTNINNPNYLKLTGGIMTGNITNLRTNDNNVSLGLNSNAGTFGVSLGNEACQNTPPTFGTHIGYRCGKNTASAYSTALGFECQQNNSGTAAIAIGYRAGYQNQHADSVIINAVTSTLNSTDSNQIIIKAGTNTLKYDNNGLNYSGVTVPTSGNVQIYGGAYVGMGNRPIMSGGYSMTSDGFTVVNTTAETSLLTGASSVGSLTVPANVMKVGSTSQWIMSGIIETNTNSETIDIRFYSGATLILNYLFTLGSKLDAGSGFRFVGDVVCRVVGGVGEIMTVGQLSVGDTNGQAVTRNISKLVNIDTTSSNTFDVRVIFGSASLNNTITAQQLTNFNIYQPI